MTDDPAESDDDDDPDADGAEFEAELSIRDALREGGQLVPLTDGDVLDAYERVRALIVEAREELDFVMQRRTDIWSSRDSWIDLAHGKLSEAWAHLLMASGQLRGEHGPPSDFGHPPE